MANTIKGTIYDPFNAPVPNMFVQAFDRDPREESLLGEGKTNSRGQYSISRSEVPTSKTSKTKF